MTDIGLMLSGHYLKYTLIILPFGFVVALLLALVPTVIAILVMPTIPRTFRRVLIAIVSCLVAGFLVHWPAIKEVPAVFLFTVALYLVGASGGAWVATLLLLLRHSDRTAKP